MWQMEISFMLFFFCCIGVFKFCHELCTIMTHRKIKQWSGLQQHKTLLCWWGICCSARMDEIRHFSDIQRWRIHGMESPVGRASPFH
jgi:hypothetical protein